MLQRFLLAALFMLFFGNVASAQSNATDYSQQWQEIDTLILARKQPKTALEKVNELYKNAKAQQDHAQLIKCLIYRISIEDEALNERTSYGIQLLKNEIANTVDTVAKSVLYSLLANQYLQYYQANRWELYGRAKTLKYNQQDIETWNTDDFGRAISDNFSSSIAHAALLQKVSITNYSAIVFKGNVAQLRPTLYDLLVHEALDYFKTGDYYFTKPAYAFELKDVQALSSADTFITTEFTSTDAALHVLKTLRLYQQLLKFHRNDTNQNAFVDVDLERIQWVYQNLVGNKANAYEQALMKVAKNPTQQAAHAYYLLAKYYVENAGRYEPLGDTSHRYDKVKALQIMTEGMAKYPEDNAWVNNLFNLKNEILAKSITTETEEVNIPNKPFLTLVSFKNIDTLFVRIIKLSGLPNISDSERNPEFAQLKDLRIYKKFYQILPSTNDYQQHRVEIKIDALPVGEYLLLTSSGAEFEDTVHKISKQLLHVSNISYVRNDTDYFVLHRDNGKPLANVKVTITKTHWNRNTQEYATNIVGVKVTDNNGYFSFSPKENYVDYQFAFVAKDDYLNHLSSEYLYRSKGNSSEDEDHKYGINYYETINTRVFFFVDRSIYRPGQTVYFKGIAITKDYNTRQPKVYIGIDSILVYLRNANNEKINSLYLKPNVYGSFAGKFIIPQNGSTGNFSVNTYGFSSVNNSFKVEEYKRPKFFIEFDSIKRAYRLNDSITITGVAKSYAGNMINGATLKFNVVRNVRFAQNWLWRNGNRPYSRNAQISDGTIVTNAEGKFTISFKALPDEAIDATSEPIFDFSVSADVTDINGETRGANQQVSVGYKSLQLNMAIAKIENADSLKQITIITKNMNGVHENANVRVKIFAIEAPKRLIRTKLWKRADLFVMDKHTYVQNFPNDDYDDELNEQLWPVKSLVFEGSIATAISDKFQIPDAKLTAGFYKIEATATDKDGNGVKDVRFTQLFSRKAMSFPDYNFSYTLNDYAEPNKSASFVRGSTAEKIFVISKVIRPRLADKERETYQFNYYKKGLRNIVYKAEETDRGNVIIRELFLCNNRVFTNDYKVVVPFNNKNLDISYTSFRNKTEPGSKEMWTVNIAGNKCEKVAAELLTAMYDASLDLFSKHEWRLPNIWDINQLNYPIAYKNGFGLVSSEGNTVQSDKKNTFLINYDLLLTSNTLTQKKLDDFNNVVVGSVARKMKNAGNDKKIIGAYGTSKSADLTGNVSSLTVGKTRSIKGPVIEEDYDKVFTIVDVTDPVTGYKFLNGRLIKAIKKIDGIIQPRKNFNETAFFFPQLHADSSGHYSFSFTMPEALTQWKWQTFAHTKDLSFGLASTTITTQKTLMVQPNTPRFVREGDKLELVAKLVNVSDKELTGQVRLELLDAATNIPVDGWFQNVFPNQYFTVAAGQSSSVKFPIQIPFSFNKPLTWRITARAGNYSDWEENTLPVLSNRMLVTESLPMLIRGDSSHHFVLDKLANNHSETLTHQLLTVEYTPNPVWTAVQALPYLMEYPYECAEQTFNRYFSNALAAYIVAKHPRIKAVFEQWQKDTTALQSNLAKNEELKQVLLQETPWVLRAASEAQQQKSIALLFDVVKMSNGAQYAIEKLKKMQLSNGAFPWFSGGNEDRYITQYLLTGIGKLKQIGAIKADDAEKVEAIVTKALEYADNELKSDYERLKRNKADLQKPQITSTQIGYLYMRSFFNQPIKATEAYNYYYHQAKQFWQIQNHYHQAMIGLALYRNKETAFVQQHILPSIVQYAIEDKSKASVYWKDRSTYSWYANPIEHQTMLLQLFETAAANGQTHLSTTIQGAKNWLLLNKQTQHWPTTIATADACCALLNHQEALDNQQVQILLGNQRLNTPTAQAGTGYFKTTIEGAKVTPQMGAVTVKVAQPKSATNNLSYGSVYWQYFEDFNKITESQSASPLSVTKKLYVEKNSDNGKILLPVNNNDEVKVGDKVVVQLVLKTDRDLDYVHLKDTRSATMEPVNVLSGYKYQDGLGYYESTKDASTNFFFGHVGKGTYVFDYPVFITHSGTFSSGIAQVQCMYAPEFTGYSKGGMIQVKKED